MLLTMLAIEVDERDSSWEGSDAGYRLYVFNGLGKAVTAIAWRILVALTVSSSFGCRLGAFDRGLISARIVRGSLRRR